MMSTTRTTTLRAVAVQSKNPTGKTVKLQDMRIPFEVEHSDELIHCLHGTSDKKAYSELLKYAEEKQLYVYSARLLLKVGNENGMQELVSLDDLASGKSPVLNVQRAKADVVKAISEIYFNHVLENYLVSRDALLERYNWAQPMDFMPEFPELIPTLIKKWNLRIVIHPTRLVSTPPGKVHMVASFKLVKSLIGDYTIDAATTRPVPAKIEI
jgi:hypothetical protein